ncbi:MAG: sensor histidine kinase [Lysobacterales bacterium]|jgi:signal transduction histidine kinase|nr:MAG: sensor histidine kinase [Xanthomonadales bacterium]
MRLQTFILREMGAILAHWERFAATLTPAASHMNSLELRDHAQQILEAIAHDLATPQNEEEQSAKSRGLAPVPFPARETAAQTHAVLRANDGFDIKQLASEYRALRASVLSLWLSASDRPEDPLEDMIRFNEAIDQALAESISHFHSQVEQARNLLFGMLGHDMRSPLQTIQMTAHYLARLNAGEPIDAAARRLMDSGARMRRLLDDLVDFNRTKLGLGVSVDVSDVSLATLCERELEQIRAAYPGVDLTLRVSGDCTGQWDGKRLQQMLCNLVVNAITHGAVGPVQVDVAGTDESVRLAVRNQGAPADTSTLRRLFSPLHRGPGRDRQDGLGLGLYIVEQIAQAHGGTVDAVATGSETVFTVELPKRNMERSGLDQDQLRPQ